ncbi:MAG: CbbQ/NirQ/NorQ/GpvN family protein [Myxococcota bacterium]
MSEQITHAVSGLETPFYRAVADECQLFQQAWQAQMPVLLKGPTGCGKTRFVEHMAHRLGRPLITVACHEDLTASDLVGRYLFRDDQTVWVDGPLTSAVRQGAICYLDEVVEARKDTVVVIHPLTDDRRILPIEKLGVVLKAAPEFMLVISYNPGYQSVIKELKQSTRQRFLALEFNYPVEAVEKEIVIKESGIDEESAGTLVRMGTRIRNLTAHGLEEGVSTRLLVYAARLMRGGLAPQVACMSALARPLTDDPDLLRSISEIVRDFYVSP